MATIPASTIVQVTPSTLSAGGNALDLSGVILTTSPRVPFGSVVAFGSATEAAAYFGTLSVEYTLAVNYFLGFLNSNRKPGALLFMQYSSAPISAYVRGGNVAGISMASLAGLSGTLAMTVDGVLRTTGNIDLSSATSFSAAASLINVAWAATGANPPLTTYDPISGAFTISSQTVGSSSSATFVSGTLASSLNLTQATGALVSGGASTDTPAIAMTRLVSQTTDWATFMTAFEPSQTDKLGFAAWTNGTNNDYAYVCWDTDVTALQLNNTTCVGYQIGQAAYSGTALIYKDIAVAAFLIGAIASIDFTEVNGRATMAFRGQSGLVPTISDATQARNLMSNGYNYYGVYATANEDFNFFYPGRVSGQFNYIDSYVNEIWMSNQFQLALIVLLVSVKSIPYNDQGYAMIKAACLDTIEQAITFGAIRAGVPLSELQAAEVDSAAGMSISNVIGLRGWYLQIRPALPQVRAARGSPPCTLWYTDGQSVQSINLASVQIQ